METTYKDYLKKLQGIGYLTLSTDDNGEQCVEISQEAVIILRRLTNGEPTDSFNQELVDYIQQIQEHERATKVSWDWVEVTPEEKE